MTGEQVSKTIDEIIEHIRDEHIDEAGAVNWGDICCVSVAKQINLWPDDSSTTLITISEASPDCSLGRLIVEHWKEMSDIQIEVRCEW